MTATKSRYRPAFSKEEIEVLDTILRDKYLTESGLATTNTPLSLADKDIYTQLLAKISTLKSKIANDAISAAYITKRHNNPLIATLEDLGASDELVAAATGGEPKEHYWLRCYDKYIETPGDCTVPEIEAAMEHRYLCGLMSPEEIAQFETVSLIKGKLTNG